MNYYKTAFFLIIVIISQITLAEHFSIKGVTPDFILIYLIFYSFKNDRASSTIIGFIGGLFQDLLGSGFIGVSSLSKSVAGFVINFFSEKGKIRKNILFYWLLISGCFLHDVIFYIFYTMGTDFNFFSMLIKYSIPATVYNFFIGSLIYFAMNK